MSVLGKLYSGRNVYRCIVEWMVVKPGMSHVSCKAGLLVLVLAAGSSNVVYGSEQPMKHQLSNRLSPAAKKALLLSAEGTTLTGLLQVSPGVDPEVLSRQLRRLGVAPGSWSATTRQMRVEVPVEQLDELVEQHGVIYFDLATPYSP